MDDTLVTSAGVFFFFFSLKFEKEHKKGPYGFQVCSFSNAQPRAPSLATDIGYLPDAFSSSLLHYENTPIQIH